MQEKWGWIHRYGYECYELKTSYNCIIWGDDCFPIGLISVINWGPKVFFYTDLSLQGQLHGIVEYCRAVWSRYLVEKSLFCELLWGFVSMQPVGLMLLVGWDAQVPKVAWGAQQAPAKQLGVPTKVPNRIPDKIPNFSIEFRTWFPPTRIEIKLYGFQISLHKVPKKLCYGSQLGFRHSSWLVFQNSLRRASPSLSTSTQWLQTF